MAPDTDVERSAASIVERAVAILEQQLAATPVSSGNGPADFKRPGAIEPALAVGYEYQRAHALLQELLGLFAGRRGDRAERARAPLPIARTAPVLQARAVKAGEALTLAVPLFNEGGAAADLIFYSTDFVSDGGFGIPSLQVSFSPRTLALAANAKGQTEMKVAVPARCPAGLYSALVQATGLPAAQAVVVLEIT